VYPPEGSSEPPVPRYVARTLLRANSRVDGVDTQMLLVDQSASIHGSQCKPREMRGSPTTTNTPTEHNDSEAWGLWARGSSFNNKNNECSSWSLDPTRPHGSLASQRLVTSLLAVVTWQAVRRSTQSDGTIVLQLAKAVQHQLAQESCCLVLGSLSLHCHS
jgi:hypothetical protein